MGSEMCIRDRFDRFVRTKRRDSLTAQGSSLENCRPKGLGGSNPSPSAIWKRVREAYRAWLLTGCGKPPQVRILPLPFSHGCAPELESRTAL